MSAPATMEQRIARFRARIKVPASEDECAEWLGYIDRDGYGMYGQRHAFVSGTSYVHRIAYELAHGPIPAGLCVDHICFNRRCCNVRHLRLLPRRENSGLQRTTLRTHCKNGHEFTKESTHILPHKTRGFSGRSCRICLAAAARLRRYMKRAAIVSDAAVSEEVCA